MPIPELSPTLQSLLSGIIGSVVGAGATIYATRNALEATTRENQRQRQDERREQDTINLIGLFSELSHNVEYCLSLKEEPGRTYPLRPLSNEIVEALYTKILVIPLPKALPSLIWAYRHMVVNLNTMIDDATHFRRTPVEGDTRGSVTTALARMGNNSNAVRQRLIDFPTDIDKVLVPLHDAIRQRDPQANISLPPRLAQKSSLRPPETS
jgi:hypothetical protein